jgi:hypothetical protein
METDSPTCGNGGSRDDGLHRSRSGRHHWVSYGTRGEEAAGPVPVSHLVECEEAVRNQTM